MFAQAATVTQPNQSPAHRANEKISSCLSAGDYRGAIAECASVFGPGLGRFCFSLLGAQADAEEAVQETLMAAHKGLPNYRGDGSVKAWLFGIARRQCARLSERRKRNQHLHLVPDDVAGKSDTAEALALARRAMKVRAALSRLKPSEREALLLRFQAGLSYREIGAACAIEEAAARKRASRGLATLRKTLSKEEL